MTTNLSSLSTRVSDASKASTLRSMVIYARLLGTAWGVNVIFDPQTKTASTNGKDIRLCPLDIGTQEDAILLEGLIDHEAGVHCRFTDFNGTLPILIKEPEVIRSLANVFEDVWGERELYKVKPGCVRSIDAALNIMVNRGLYGPPSPTAHPASSMINMLLGGLRAVKLNQVVLADFYLAHRQRLQEQVGAQVVEQIWATAQKIDQIFDSIAAIDLAKEVFGILKQELQQQQQQQQGQTGPQGQQDQSQQQGQSGSQGQKGQQDQNQQQGQSGSQGQQDQQSQSQADQPPGQSAHQKPLGKPGQKPSETLTKEQLANLEKVLRANQQEAGTGEFADSLAQALSEQAAPQHLAQSGAGSQWELGERKPVANPGYEISISSLSRPIAVRLGSKLDQILAVETTTTTEYSVRGRRLTGRLLPRVFTSASMRVFKRTDEQEGLDVAVAMLQDVSASMSSKLDDGVKCIDAVGASTRALGDTLDRFDVPFAVYNFGSRLTRLKAFDQRWRRTKNLHHSDLENSTCTHQALNAVVPDLASRPEERKLLILETDGIPSDPKRTAVALSEAKRLGLDVAVFLVGATHAVNNQKMSTFTSLLKSYGIPHSIANNSGDISNVVFDAVSSATSKR